MKKARGEAKRRDESFELMLEAGELSISLSKTGAGATLRRTLSLNGLRFEQVHHFRDDKSVRGFIEIDEYFGMYPEFFNGVWRAAIRLFSSSHAKNIT